MLWTRQRIALALAALVTAGAALALARGQDPAEVEVVEARALPREATRPPEASPVFLPPERDLDPDALADLFEPRTFAPPPPPPPPPPPKPVELAPAFPYKLLGLAEADGQLSLFLSKQGRNFVVRAGDVLERVYRLEEIRGGQAVFIYQPLNERQILPLEK